ncbi:MAG: hypothetical protein R2851_08500 [Caldilineaceae bacterium]
MAIDATHRPRASGATPEELIRAIQQELDVLVMADVDTLEEGRLAAAAGADVVASTPRATRPRAPPQPGPTLRCWPDWWPRWTSPSSAKAAFAPADVRAALEIGARGRHRHGHHEPAGDCAGVCGADAGVSLGW